MDTCKFCILYTKFYLRVNTGVVIRAAPHSSHGNLVHNHAATVTTCSSSSVALDGKEDLLTQYNEIGQRSTA
jgi:hypothetical protein